MQNNLTGAAPLPHWGVIRVVGADAATFLHGQLTQDFALLGQHQARLAALCNAQGRMLASFIGIKCSATEVLLVCNQDLLAAMLKRLSMFVLRAKAQLSDASVEFALWGVVGDAVCQNNASPWATTLEGEARVVQLYPALGLRRALWVTPKATPAPHMQALSAADWAWLEVHSGVAMINATTAQTFVPQMLNYESIGGVNFKKGCYPGQEVVARSQFRGTLKRRAYLAHADAPMKPGDEVYRAQADSEAIATVVQAAPHAQGGFGAIVSGRIDALQAGDLHLSSPTGPALQVTPVPYPLLADV